MPLYPTSAPERDRFIIGLRPARRLHDPWRAQGVLVEDERTAQGSIAPTATIFLTGRECPWRCAMCDLWRHTIERDTPSGAIADQIRRARRSLSASHATGGGRADTLKLYNAGSFFDPRAVPEADYDDIASTLRGLSRVIVESHPSFVGPRTMRWLEALDRSARPDDGPAPALEVAMGLETVHLAALDRLNKRMTVDDFRRAAERLAALNVALRAFVLVSPPFVPRAEHDEWLLRSVDAALTCGASVVTLIATRPGNGTLEALAAEGEFCPPSMADLERSVAIALALARQRHGGSGRRVFADVWDLERLASCPACFPHRHARLTTMNIEQRPSCEVECDTCGAAGAGGTTSPVAQ